MLDVASPHVLYFDKFSLDLARGCLRAGDQDIELRPKAFEVLRCLATKAGRLVTKQELYEAVWPNVIVSDDSIAQCIRELRGKLFRAQKYLNKSRAPRRFSDTHPHPRDAPNKTRGHPRRKGKPNTHAPPRRSRIQAVSRHHAPGLWSSPFS